MELFGAISSGDQWRSNDLNGIIYSSDHDHHDYHQFMSSDSDVPNYDLNHIGASSLEIPFTIWSSCDSTIVHDEPSGNYGALEFRSANMFLNIGCDDINHDWMNVNDQLQARDVSGEESNAGQSTQAHVVPQSRWESEMIALTDQPSIGLGSLSGSSKKRARSTIANDDQDSKSKRNVKSKKSQKIAPSDDEEDVNADIKGPISPNSPLSAGENSNVSHEELGGTASTSSPKGPAAALNLNGKTRASRGSATDPQSVYARKRREKINERLRTLQNLVPNGTKVDISTMLEEAVQYVKFLQLQIKLLSSDDLWMYAPLAYNGMGIGLDLGLINSPRL